MLKAGGYFAQAVQSSSRFGTFFSRNFYRNVTTNSAIHRGIRRSREGTIKNRDAASRDKIGTRDAGTTMGRRPTFLEDRFARDQSVGGNRGRTGGTGRSRSLEFSSKHDDRARDSFSGPGRDRTRPEKQRYSPRTSEYTAASSASTLERYSSNFSMQNDSLDQRRERAGRYASIEQPLQRTYASGRNAFDGRSSPNRHRRGSSDELSVVEKRDYGSHRFNESPTHGRFDSKDRGNDRQFWHRETANLARDCIAPKSGIDQTRFAETDRPQREIKSPLTIPYTTPASEFLYGTSVVIAALKSSHRKLYKLYMYNGEHREVANQDNTVRKLALAAGVEIFQVDRDWVRLMDKMSAGRPHNGYILEASPLPKLPITGLLPVEGKQKPLNASLDHQSREDEAVNGADPSIKYNPTFPRYPFLLMLDGILDPGNLGGILRSAYFLGVDAVAISNRNSAPLSPVALKASAGASESLPLLFVGHPAAFVEACQKNGWKFYAAVAPPDRKSSVSASSRVTSHLSTSDIELPDRDHPTVLMLGGEGEGLRWNLEKKADFTVSIGGCRKGEGGVDSLNVSVAAGLLCEAFLRKPTVMQETQPRSSIVEETTSVVTGKDLF